ncbi:unnamed protein product [Amaranthus hypochondriacus]
MVGRGRGSRGGRGGGRGSAVQTRSSSEQQEQTGDSIEVMAVNRMAVPGHSDEYSENSAAGDIRNEGPTAQLEELRKQFQQLKDFLEEKDKNQARVSDSKEPSKQLKHMEDLNEEQQDEEGKHNKRDEFLAQLDDLKQQLSQLQGKLDGMDTSGQFRKQIPAADTNMGKPTTSWKDKVMPKLSQKDKNQPQAAAGNDPARIEPTRQKHGNEKLNSSKTDNRQGKNDNGDTVTEMPASPKQCAADTQAKEAPWTVVRKHKTTKRTTNEAVEHKAKQQATSINCEELKEYESTIDGGGIPTNPSSDQ